MKRATDFAKIYEQLHERYAANSWMCGRVTMEDHFTFVTVVVQKLKTLFGIDK